VQSALVVVPYPFNAAGVRVDFTVITEGGGSDSGSVVWNGKSLVGEPGGIFAARVADDGEGVEFDVTNGAFHFVASVPCP
jgi:hypothetical protein